MTAVGVSSGIFCDIFSTEPMRRIFADENRVQKYLDIEAALARAQARLGIIPQEACDEIARHCHAREYDFAKLKTMAVGGLIGAGFGLLAGILGCVAVRASLTALILPMGIGFVAGAFMAWQGYYG